MFLKYKKLNRLLMTLGIANVCMFTFCGVAFSDVLNTEKNELNTQKVQVKSNEIYLEKEYIVLKEEEKYKLEGSNVTYSSMDSSIAKVSYSGEIEAIKEGKTSIIIKSADLIGNLTVIVNKKEQEVCLDKDSSVVSVVNNSIENDNLYQIINSSYNKKIVYNMNENVYNTNDDKQHSVSENSLEMLYRRGILLSIVENGYELLVDGKNIENYTRTLNTLIDFKKTKQGYVIERQVKDKLPGKVILKINDKSYKGKYFYIYNKNKGKYILLSDEGINSVELENDAKYLVTDEELYKFKLDYRVLAIAAGVIFVLVIIYIIVKKKYWFW